MSPAKVRDGNRYAVILEDIFHRHHTSGATTVAFKREEFADAAKRCGVDVPKNLGDLVYSFRYRNELPQSIQDKAPEGFVWIIRPAGRSLYQFAAVRPNAAFITPNESLSETKIPDATPGIISRYALSDE